MKPFYGTALGAAVLFAAPVADQAAAQRPSFNEKLNAYVGCINRLSERSYDSRSRYFSWAAKTGPTGKERIIYGTYTIYYTSDCVKNVEKANGLEPHDAALETAASAYAKAPSPSSNAAQRGRRLLHTGELKDDKMAKGRALHPFSSPHGTASRTPTRRCAAMSRSSTTSARW